MRPSIREIALLQIADYDRRTPGTWFAGNAHTLSIAEAYEVQFEVARLRVERGESIAGYKIGCTSPVIQAQLGLDRPVFGHVWEGELRPSPAVLDWTMFDGLAIEGEFAMRLGDGDPRPLPVIELHNYVFRNTPHSAQELIGNNAIHAGVVMSSIEGDGEDLHVYRNGGLLGEARDPGPIGRLRWLEEQLSRYGVRLMPGQIVLTGTPLPLYRVSPGDEIEVTCGSFEPVVARVAAL